MPISPQKRFLMSRVQDAIYASGWKAIFENDDHPCLVRVFKEESADGEAHTRDLLVYIWELTSGGPESVRPQGEFRIQITGVSPPLKRSSKFQTLLLGWHRETGVFAGFDVSRHHNWGKSPSIQIRKDAVDAAQLRGIGVYRRATEGTAEMAIAFVPEAFMDYVARQAELHEFAEHEEDLKVLENAAKGKSVDLDRIAGSGRKKAVRTVMQRIGQDNFRSRILAVYDHRCAACEVQLDLVQAAHIVPVNSGGDNSTTNGLALCSLHHDAYDRALLGIRPDYKIATNAKTYERLQTLDRVNRWDNFRENLRKTIKLPDREMDHPKPQLLQKGLELRGWN